MKDTITNIFIEIDDFCKTYDAEIVAFLRTIYSKNFVWKHEIALSEILTISIYFHLSSKTTFKDYYFDVFLLELNSEFKNFLTIAKGSNAEFRSQLYRCLDRKHILRERFDVLYERNIKLGNKLMAFINYLQSSEIKGQRYRKSSKES